MLSSLHPRFSRSREWPVVNYADIWPEVHIKHIWTGREGHLSMSLCRAYGNQMVSVAKSQWKVLPRPFPPCGARKAWCFSLPEKKIKSTSFLFRGLWGRRSAAFAPDRGGNGGQGILPAGRNGALRAPKYAGAIFRLW